MKDKTPFDIALEDLKLEHKKNIKLIKKVGELEVKVFKLESKLKIIEAKNEHI